MSEHIIETEMFGDTAFVTIPPKEPKEEIVRCRDCTRFELDNSDHDYRSGWWCHRWNTDMVRPNGFCAWACRKEQQ